MRLRQATVVIAAAAMIAAGWGTISWAQTSSDSREATGVCTDNPDGSTDCDLHITPPATTTTSTSSTSTTSTVQPTTTSVTSTSTTSTVAPSTAPPTTAAPATTTTVKPTTTTAAPTTTQAPTTTASPVTTTTAPPAGVAFSEDFADPQAFYNRFDHGFEGDEGGTAIADYPGDHDGSCGDPNLTHRNVHVSNNNKEAAFYPCAPAGDPAKAHVMTAVNTEGYVIAWFSPKAAYANVRTVCWDQNIQDLGGGKWTQVVFITAAEAARASAHGSLGFTSPEFSDPGGTGTNPGKTAHGVKLEGGGMTAWSSIGEWNLYKPGTVQRPFPGNVGTTTDHAPRFRQCLTDNGTGTLTATRVGPAGTQTSTVQGSIPDEPVRVVFEDDNYNPDKHNNANGVPLNGGQGYTWHWDNIQIVTG